MDNEDLSKPSAAARLTDRVLVWIATGFGAGRAPVAPGTWGSLWGLPLAWAMQKAELPVAAYVGVSLAVILVGVAACAAGARHFGRKDPPSVVIDEIAAFPLVFAVVEFGVLSAVLGFALFRLFDVWKPWPIRWLEYLPGGWGVMADDLLAGVYAGAVLWGVMRVVEGA